MDMVNTANSEHYTWGGNCDGWRLAQGDALSVIEERMPPGTSERTHHHVRARQFFYVLSGTLSMEVDGRVLHLQARHGLEVPPGVCHRAFNAGPGPAEFLLASSPTTRGDRIEDVPHEST